MANRYPWYEVVASGKIEQGDILLSCPVIALAPELTFPINDTDLTIDIKTFDVVVITQSCDLENDKVKDVILCPHWDLNIVGDIDDSLVKKDVQKAILKGRMPRYIMLEASKISELPMGVRIVDFGRIFSLPKVFLCQFAARKPKHLRLCPPYREHLSQAFARFFMRVGLPQDIELPR